MVWFILGAIAIIVILIIINSNIIILNKNFITFYEKFKGVIGAFIDFGNNYLMHLQTKSAGLDQGQNRVQPAAPVPIAKNVNFIQRYCILKEGAPEDTMEILDMSEYERFNLVMLEIWITRDFLKSILGETIGADEALSDEELLKYVPPIACASANVYAIVDDNGAIGFSADYNSELISFNMEDDQE